jgi:hypothetical protein
MRPTTLAASLAALIVLSPTLLRADGAAAKPAVPSAKPAAAAKEPDHITIQHVLIGFVGSVPGKNITRTQEEAGKLAADVYARAKKGEDFDALVTKYTDDSAPGFYSMANNGVAPAQGEYARSGMVPAFGDAGFPLAIGQIGIANYDKARSPFGWHIVKRVK